jgi:hypothetical protein
MDGRRSAETTTFNTGSRDIERRHQKTMRT